MKHWRSQEIKLLARLRARFIDGTAGDADYWSSPEELALYDEIFAERIGWKIDAVIRGLMRIGWQPRSRRIVDWGCGTGIASRRVIAAWPGFADAGLFDRSSEAMRFARQRLTATHPEVRIGPAVLDRDTLLVVSHVLNELPETARDSLLEAADKAGEVIWVEAGTHADSRRLIAMREQLLQLPDPPRLVAPCTHQLGCGLLTEQNSRHWCHHFAHPPSEVFQNARWAEMSRELGIDLRSLPYSHLVLSRHSESLHGFARIVGVPRESKGYIRLLNCDESGVRELTLQKRDDPALFKTLVKTSEYPPYRLNIVDEKIVSAEAYPDPQE